MAITLKSIARKAGVSANTVSLALKDSPRISDGTRELVKSLAAEMNYVPNSLAKALTQKKTNTIGIVLTDIMDPTLSTMVQSLESNARKNGYSVILSLTNNDVELERQCLKVLHEKRVDGVVLFPAHVGDYDHVRKARQSYFPIVTLLNILGTDYVAVDNLEGAYAATTHLISLGHTRIAYLCGLKTFPNLDKLEGYKRALKDHGIEFDPDLLVPSGPTQKEGHEATLELFKSSKNPPTAIFARIDYLALGALSALRRLGLRVPDDVSIVGYGDIEGAAFAEVPLTTLNLSGHKMGELAINLLLDRIQSDKGDLPHQVVIKPTLVIRESTGRVKK